MRSYEEEEEEEGEIKVQEKRELMTDKKTSIHWLNETRFADSDQRRIANICLLRKRPMRHFVCYHIHQYTSAK